MRDPQFRSSWLFLRRNASILVFRQGPPWLQLAIAGPGGNRQTLRFANEDELRAFQRDHEQQLIVEGWHLDGVDVERRHGRDRRRVQRGPDRRGADVGDRVRRSRAEPHR